MLSSPTPRSVSKSSTPRVVPRAPTATFWVTTEGRATAALGNRAPRLHRLLGLLRHVRRGSNAPVSSLSTLSQRAQTVVTWHRPLVGFAALMLVWGGAAGVAAVLDRRRLDGARVWVKPLKFTISLGIYAVTLAWMLSMVTNPLLRRVGRRAGTFGAAACLLEIAIITLQAARGRRSHFNVSTTLDSRLYAVAGLALPAFYGVTLVIGALVTVFSRPVDRSLLWALRSGLAVGVSRLTVGFAMGRPTPSQRAELHPTMVGSHSVGGDDPSGGLPFLGWNTQHGDLRVPHFVGMHALQGMPLLALALRGLTGDQMPESTRVRIVLASAATWAAITGTALQQALRGRPVTRIDGVTGTLLAETGLLASVAARAIRRHSRRIGRRAHPSRRGGR